MYDYEPEERYIEMRRVPGYVWDQVYDKWCEALKDGWNDKLWNRCSLCRWVHGVHQNCYECPLGRHNWCNGNSLTSRLSGNPDGLNPDLKSWEREVKEFLRFIDPYRII